MDAYPFILQSVDEQADFPVTHWPRAFKDSDIKQVLSMNLPPSGDAQSFTFHTPAGQFTAFVRQHPEKNPLGEYVREGFILKGDQTHMAVDGELFEEATLMAKQGLKPHDLDGFMGLHDVTLELEAVPRTAVPQYQLAGIEPEALKESQMLKLKTAPLLAVVPSADNPVAAQETVTFAKRIGESLKTTEGKAIAFGAGATIVLGCALVMQHFLKQAKTKETALDPTQGRA